MATPDIQSDKFRRIYWIEIDFDEHSSIVQASVKVIASLCNLMMQLWDCSLRKRQINRAFAVPISVSDIMFGAYQNITTALLLQNAISVLLDKMGMEINSHAACVLTDGNSHNNEVHLNHLPAVRGDCHENVFINQVQHGVASGCSFFVVSEGCVLPFLDNYHRIHDWVDQKYEKKILAVIDAQRILPYRNVMDILTHRIVINELPLTLLLQPNVNNEWICVWSAYPYDSYAQNYNRFFVGNFSFEYDKQIIPKITDLNGLVVTGAFIDYPPYSSYDRVPPGTGNAQLFNCNESRPLYLDGQEHLIILEFCARYNCTLTARLEYDEVLWGEVFDNQTGNGLLGALVMREANVSVAALYLWELPYKFNQYSPIIQKATATQIIPIPLPLPYWQTPILPFPGYIWGFVMSSLLIATLTVFVVNAMLSKVDNRAHGQEAFGLFDSMYAVFKISIFQGVTIRTNFLSNISIFAAILIFALNIGNLYCGGLSSVMTITRYESPIENLETLVESKFVLGGSTYWWLDAFEYSDYPPHKKFISQFVVKSVPELRQMVRQRRVAVSLEQMQHGALSYQSYLERKSSKQYLIMKHSMYWQYTVVMATKTWPFMEQLNRIVMMQQENGLQYYWEYHSSVRLMDYAIQRNLEENGKKSQHQDAVPVKLSVEHILGALFVLLLGSALSVVCFSLEILVKYFSDKKLKVVLNV